ncbi:MAG TPA: patatin-like phospholipase family protein [Anaerolineaceae bacterium]|nr:patatin-like phospholipase family protein [Anaerolineaceae bacterium]HPN51156.1 patatin-like phospholipase family protein [Anaerolineaceae bacterium]
MEIALALGGGGIRGLAHVGVIRSLESLGYKIRAIAGTSAGSIVGALYAASLTTQDMQAIFNDIVPDRMFARKIEDGPSLMGLGGMEDLLHQVLGNRTFEDLPFPFATAAVDTASGQEMMLHHGNLVQAVLASSAVPGIFPPRQIGPALLMDGGVLDPVPVSIARWLAPDLPVVAVVLNQPAPDKADTSHPLLPIPIPGPTQLVEQISRMRLAQAFSVFSRSLEISSLMMTELRLQIDRPDVIIRPMVTDYSLLGHYNVDDLVSRGEKAGLEARASLEQAVSWPSALARKLRSTLTPEPEPVNHDLNA